MYNFGDILSNWTACACISSAVLTPVSRNSEAIFKARVGDCLPESVISRARAPRC